MEGSFPLPGDDGDLQVLKRLAAHLLPGQRSSKKHGWRPSGPEIVEGFVKELLRIDELDIEQARKSQEAVKRGTTVQGYIVRIQSGTNVNYYVVLDLLKYIAPTIIGALDLLLKLHLSYNVKYTYECGVFYTFLQRVLLEVETDFDLPNTKLYLLENKVRQQSLIKCSSAGSA